MGTDPFDHNKRLSNETVTIVTRGVQSPKRKDEGLLAFDELVAKRLGTGRGTPVRCCSSCANVDCNVELSKLRRLWYFYTHKNPTTSRVDTFQVLGSFRGFNEMK